MSMYGKKKSEFKSLHEMKRQEMINWLIQLKIILLLLPFWYNEICQTPLLYFLSEPYNH